MFSTLANWTGRCIGEVVHQGDKLVDDVMAIPSALSAGYDEELFEKKTEEIVEQEVVATVTANPVKSNETPFSEETLREGIIAS